MTAPASSGSSELAAAVPPTVTTPVAAVVPPGQDSEYWPGCRSSVNEPDNPATRFSFSPRMRAPLSTSASLTRPVPALVILNVVRPASSLIVAGSQPASVSLISTAFGPPPPVAAGLLPAAVGWASGVAESPPPQPASTTAHNGTHARSALEPDETDRGQQRLTPVLRVT